MCCYIHTGTVAAQMPHMTSSIDVCLPTYTYEHAQAAELQLASMDAWSSALRCAAPPVMWVPGRLMSVKQHCNSGVILVGSGDVT